MSMTIPSPVLARLQVMFTDIPQMGPKFASDVS